MRASVLLGHGISRTRRAAPESSHVKQSRLPIPCLDLSLTVYDAGAKTSKPRSMTRRLLSLSLRADKLKRAAGAGGNYRRFARYSFLLPQNRADDTVRMSLTLARPAPPEKHSNKHIHKHLFLIAVVVRFPGRLVRFARRSELLTVDQPPFRVSSGRKVT